MRKTRYIIVGIILTLVTVLTLTGGIYIYTGPQYKSDIEYESFEEGEGFIPKHFHLEYNATDAPLVPVLLHNVHSELPKNINLTKYDITYLKTHEGFTSFRIDELTITYDNGKTVILVNDEQPESTRTFQVTENWFDAIIFTDAIQEKSNFLYQIKGVSFSKDGSPYPFKYAEKYKYSYIIRVRTRYQKWASI
ncbi:MAG: hypothetical protein OHK0012_26180 [Synechococcales cyanobacterium]